MARAQPGPRDDGPQPDDPPPKTWVAAVIRTVRQGNYGVFDALKSFSDNGNFVIAGHLSFVALMSVFPFMVLLITAAGSLGTGEEATSAIQYSLAELPDEVAAVLLPVIDSILAQPSGGVLSVSLVAALWAASSGFEAMRIGLNTCFRVKPKRELWWRRLQSIVLVVLFAIFGALIALLFVLAPLIAEAISWILGRPDLVPWGSKIISSAIVLCLLVLVTAALYRFLPNADPPWRIVFRAAIAAVVLWAFAVQAFQVYVTYVATSNAVYGSIGGVITLLLFFYITACIFLFGGEYSAAVERRRRVA